MLRLSATVRTWLPVVVRLGHFDCGLLTKMAGGDDAWFQERFLALTKVIDLERGAVWSSGRSEDVARRAGTDCTWVLDCNVVRLESDHRDNDLVAWGALLPKLRAALAESTRERPWAQLTPSYFAVAFDLLSDEPAELVRWWSDIERRIQNDDAWTWGKQIVAALPINAYAEDRQRYPGSVYSAGRAVGHRRWHRARCPARGGLQHRPQSSCTWARPISARRCGRRPRSPWTHIHSSAIP